MHCKSDTPINQAWASLRIGVCADVVVCEDMKSSCNVKECKSHHILRRLLPLPVTRMYL